MSMGTGTASMRFVQVSPILALFLYFLELLCVLNSVVP